MLGWVILESSGRTHAAEFFETRLAENAPREVMSDDRLAIFRDGSGQPLFTVCTPVDGEQTATAPWWP